jgi:hypothetical protein
LPAASVSPSFRAKAGAATLVPDWMNVEPVNVPVAMTPRCAAESSATAEYVGLREWTSNSPELVYWDGVPSHWT